MLQFAKQKRGIKTHGEIAEKFETTANMKLVNTPVTNVLVTDVANAGYGVFNDQSVTRITVW